MRFACALALLGLVTTHQSTTSESVGVWKGESICASHQGACVDEHVVYDIRALADKPGVVSIRADKIVDGNTILMGTSEWQYDAIHHTLTWETPRQTWVLHITGDAIDGTLTLADKTVIRHVTLKKTAKTP